jgi:hypothetical protein
MNNWNSTIETDANLMLFLDIRKEKREKCKFLNIFFAIFLLLPIFYFIFDGKMWHL